MTIDKHDPLVFRGHVIYRLTSYSSTTINYNHTPQQALLGPAYPQPARTRVQVPYTVEHAGTLRFDLYDAMGRHIRTLRAGEESPGSRVLDVDVAGLRAGLYFVRVTTPSGVDVRRISVLP
ncbi:MAG: T9SS type A sorting domain-containing protein [Ignavibacteriae bacterium]|nr:T9SS type A sorting domain-containing protein [Ignavibacteriota bacterium]